MGILIVTVEREEMALPFLPGNSFKDPTKQKYHLSHSLGYKNGYSVADRPEVGIGGEPVTVNQLTESELDELANFKPSLTYGQAKQAPPQDFIPAHVAFDKKVLKFMGYFKQTIHESPMEYYRVRPVNIYYYLEDDSISVVEPHVENSGIPQGKLIRRQRLPKNDQGDHWHWKDLNLGINVTFYGKVFHIIDCDKFTTEFMDSEGIILNPLELMPQDPYASKRKTEAELRTFNTPSDFDKLKQFMQMDRKVLRFYCVWDDRDAMFGELRPYIIHYYLVDDTVEVREFHEPNDGRDPFPLLLRRQKLPKDRYNVESSYPGIVLELSDHEIKDYYTPKDFGINKTIFIYNRRFLIYDCDDFTKRYYNDKFGISDFTPLEVKGRAKNLPKMDLPPYNGFGSLEDSLQSCLSLIPQPPKKDFIKMLENDHKILRYEATLDSPRPEDSNRRFIITYRLSDDTIMIFEPPVRNSGIIGGKFLERTRVTKPGSTPDDQSFYGPQDLYIGAVIEVFKHRFVILDADDYVLKYMDQNKDDFPNSETALHSLRTKKMGQTQAKTQTPAKGGPLKVERRPGDKERLVEEIHAQLQKNNYINYGNLTEAFLKLDKDRSGFVDINELKLACHRNNLPLDDDIIDALIGEEDLTREGKIDYHGFVKLLNWGQ